MPSVLTPGRFIFADPLKDTPPIVLAFCNSVAVSALPVTAPSKFATKVPVLIVKLPVLAPVNDPVPTTNLSSLSSNPIKAFTVSPRSITIPASFVGLPVVPFPSSISESLTNVLVVLIVVVSPFTIRFQVTVKSCPIVTSFGSPNCTVTTSPVLLTVASISLEVPSMSSRAPDVLKDTS